MASQNIARLGVVLGLDTAEFTASIDKAISENAKLKNAIRRDTNSAAGELKALVHATEDYGKTLTKVELIQREVTSGKFMNATKDMKDRLLQQAAAYDKMAMSAKNAAGAQFKLNEQQKIQLTYQTTDLFTQIASGQSPFIAILQQGGQLKDVMGGIGPMFRAIGTLITPFTVSVTAAAAAVGALAYSFINADKESAAFRDNMILTGRFAGVTESQVAALSQKLGTDLNVGYSKANDVIIALISSGKFTSAVIDDMSKVILQFSKLSGVDAKEAAQKLMGAFDGTAASVRTLDSQYNFLTLAQYKQIIALEKAGKAQEAIKLGVKAFGDSIDGQKRDLGTLEKAWKAVGEAITYAKDAILGFGRNSDQDKLVKLAQDIERISSDIGGTDTLSIANRSNNKKLLQEKMDDYLALAKKMQGDVATAQKESDKKADEERKKRELDRYGPMLISKQTELEKAKIDTAFKLAEVGTNEIEKLELDSAKKIVDAYQEMRQKNQQEDGRATAQNLEIYKSKVTAAETELAEKKRQINMKRMIAQYNDEQAVADEFNAAWAIENNRRAALVVGAQNQTRELEFQRESLDLKYQMIYATEREQKLAQISLEYARKRREVEGQDPLVMKELDRQEELAKMFVVMQESARRTQQVFDSVFGNLSSAIDNFVKTGKLSMKDLARSIIQDLIAIQMKAMVLRFLGSAFANISAAGTYGTIPGSQQTNMLAAQDAGFLPRANGGPVSANGSYLVGERGPELFMPSGSGTIIPNNQMGNMGGQTNVTNNYINAIDVKSFEDRLLGSSNTIWAANQYANKNLSTNFGRT
jgi:phage-related minor tail protein